MSFSKAPQCHQKQPPHTINLTLFSAIPIKHSSCIISNDLPLYLILIHHYGNFCSCEAMHARDYRNSHTSSNLAPIAPC